MAETEETKRARVLVVDDEPTLLRALEALLRRKGYEVTALESPIAATQRLAQEDFDVALLDIKMPQLSGLELLSAVKHRRPEVEVIMMTGHATVETALAAVKAGAYDYLTKPFEDVELVARAVGKAAERKMLFDRNRQLETQLRERERRAVRRARRQLGRHARGGADDRRGGLQRRDRARHRRVRDRQGARRARAPREEPAPRPPVRRAQLRRAHRDAPRVRALRPREGRLHRRAARLRRGSSTPPTAAPSSSTRSATSRRRPRCGSCASCRRASSSGSARPSRCTSTCASSRRRTATCRSWSRPGKFREDLFYRLNVINIPLPPLRDRVEDVPLLAHHFLRRYAERLAKKVRAVAPEALELLSGYRWPGNVRELENAIERAVVLCRGDVVLPGDLPPAVTGRTAPLVREAPVNGDEAAWLSLSYAAAKEQALRRFEKGYVDALMKACDSNISAAARKAGMDRSNFKRVLRKYRADVEPDSGDEGSDRATG